LKAQGLTLFSSFSLELYGDEEEGLSPVFAISYSSTPWHSI